MPHDDVKQKCTFQLVSAKDGIRSEPFTMSFAEALGFLQKHCPPDEHEQHYVLVVAEYNEVGEASVSSRPLIYVRTFISLVRELSK